MVGPLPIGLKEPGRLLVTWTLELELDWDDAEPDCECVDCFFAERDPILVALRRWNGLE